MKHIKNFKFFKINESTLFDTPEYIEGDYHQLIMNLGYDKWQRNDKWDYTDMLDHVDSEYGPEFKMMIMLGKYNQQVGNGGHHQYYDNGYASVGGGVFSEKNGIALHEEMMDLFEKSELYKMDPICNQVYSIMDKFYEEMRDFDEHCQECDNGYFEETCWDCNGEGTQLDTCPECGGSGEIDDDTCPECNGNGEIEVDCETCDGSGTSEEKCQECDEGHITPNVEYLDDEYYEVGDRFMEVCNDYAKKLIDELI